MVHATVDADDETVQGTLVLFLSLRVEKLLLQALLPLFVFLLSDCPLCPFQYRLIEQPHEK